MICNIIDFTALIPFINKNNKIKKVYILSKQMRQRTLKKKIKTWYIIKVLNVNKMAVDISENTIKKKKLNYNWMIFNNLKFFYDYHYL